MMDYFKRMNNYCKALIVIAIVLSISFFTYSVNAYNKQIPINQASICQIDKVPQIGCKLATKIYNYVREKQITNIDELIYIDGIGEKRLIYLKEVFR